MTDIALPGSIEPARRGPDLSGAINPITGIIFGGVIAAVLLFVAYSIYSDVDAAGTKVTTYLPFLLLFVALLIALGFEFVNGFHDTANAVATVIYTHSLPANVAVVWSGVWNFARRSRLLGRGRLRHHLAAAGRADPAGRQQRRLRDGFRAADRGDHLEPRHLVVRPAGLELAHADRLDHRRRHRQRADARPQRHVAASIGARRRRSAKRCCSRRWSASSLAAALLLLLKGHHPHSGALCRTGGRTAAAVVDPRPARSSPARGVSFFHGSNDGQKGMGLIMLILIGTVPTAYALNRALPRARSQQFVAASQAASAVIEQQGGRLQRPRRSAPGRHGLRCAAAASTRAPIRRLAVAGARHRRPGQAIRVAGADAGSKPSATSATTCTSPPRRSAS